MVLPVKRGLSSPAVTNIPDKWDRQWFRYFIDNYLTNADIRNVTGVGITISGNVSGNSTSGTPSNSVTISQTPVANNTVMGNISGAVAVPVALTQTQLTALVNLFSSTLSGAVPLSGGGTINFLRADGTWNVPAGSAAIPNNTVLGNVSGGVATAVALNTTQLTTLINAFTSLLSGAVPASGGGTTNFLRADATWAAPGYPTGANPTGTVGLSAVNGSAATFLRSDGAPALSQSIVPTWTGIHTFSARPAFNLGATVAGGTFISRGISDSATATALTIASTGAITVAAPSSGNAFSVTGVNSAIATVITSGLPAGTGGADLKVVRAGSTINQAAQGPNLFLNDSTNSTGYYLQDSGGQFEIWSSTGGGPTLTQILKVLTAGGLVYNAPTSGVAFAISGLTGSDVLQVTAAGNTSFSVIDSTDSVTAIVNANSGGVVIGATTNHLVNLRTNNTNRISIAAAGAVTINAPTSGTALTVTAVAGTNAAIFAPAATSNTAPVALNNGNGTFGPAFNFGTEYFGTGAATPVLTANKPTGGGTAIQQWLQVQVNGTVGYIPVWQ